MKKLAFRRGVGRIVTLKNASPQDREDRCDRLLRYLTAGGLDFGRSLISAGWAKTYVYERDFLRGGTYRRSQASARPPSAARGASAAATFTACRNGLSSGRMTR